MCVTQEFIPSLKNHILARLTGNPFDEYEQNFTQEDRQRVEIYKDRLYTHQTMQINYTTYDRRRDQDTLNIRTHADVMLLAQEDNVDPGDEHPYWYARVCAIYHAYVRLAGSQEWQPIEIAWIRWFGRAMDAVGGFKKARLDRIGFVPSDQEAPFGFLDPSLILRVVHLVPGFAHGRTNELLPGASVIRQQQASDDEDWRYFYINMYVFISLAQQRGADIALPDLPIATCSCAT